MSLFEIAWKSIQQRRVASSLTAFTMGLGVLLVVIVISIHNVIYSSFDSNASLGYNMIVGAKGGKLQLTLNSVFYLSSPIENIPYDYYLEFLERDARDAEYEHSIQFAVANQAEETMQLAQSCGWLGDPGGVANRLASEAATDYWRRVSDNSEFFTRPVKSLDRGRHGQFGQLTGLAIPLCLGDYFGRFRVVGTTPEMFTKLKFGPQSDRTYEFRQGRNFQTWSQENSYFEAVVGSVVAREMKVAVGDQVSLSHGDPESGEEHGEKFTIVGILAPTGTPNDRAAFVNIEGFYLMEDHAKPVESEGDQASPDSPVEVPQAEQPSRLPIEQREVTAILVRTGQPLFAPGMESRINEGSVAQAVLPIREIYNLFAVIVGPIKQALLILTGVICFVSGVGILVSIYNSMSERKHEIAVMRALGAGRGTVMMIILLESIIIAVGGGVAGWALAHVLGAGVSPWIEARTGVRVGLFDFAIAEATLVPAILVLAVLVGLIPALSAYRTDVAQSLGK